MKVEKVLKLDDDHDEKYDDWFEQLIYSSDQGEHSEVDNIKSHISIKIRAQIQEAFELGKSVCE